MKGIKVLRQSPEGHMLITYPNGKGGFYYRSEQRLGQMLLGSTYNTLQEAESDYAACLEYSNNKVQER